MKSLSFTQLILLVVVIVVVVFGLGFILASQRGTTGSNADLPPAKDEVRFDQERSPIRAIESKTEGRQEFWFVNDSDKPCQVSLRSKSCQCTEVTIGMAPAEWKNLPEEKQKPVPPPSETQWQELSTKEQAGVTVPPRATGWVRLKWKEDMLGLKLLTADLRISHDQKAVRLEVPILFSPAIRVAVIQDRERGETTDMNLPVVSQPENLIAKVDDLLPGDKRTVEFVCWSSFRPKFELAMKSANPCIVPGEPVELTKEECEKFFRPAKDDLPEQPVRYGYRVPVTIHERIDDGKQLDLGLFQHEVVFSVTNPDVDGTAAFVRGFVRGDLTVLTPDGRDRIVFGSFKQKEGIVKKHIMLRSATQDLQLEADKETPDFMVVTLNEVKKEDKQQSSVKEWEMEVQIKPKSIFGPFSHREMQGDKDYSIYLNLMRDNKVWRRIRIPVQGNATN